MTVSEFRAYGKGGIGGVTAATPKAAALAFFEKFPERRKCNVIEGETDGHFFSVKFGLNADGNKPQSWKGVTKKLALTLPDN